MLIDEIRIQVESGHGGKGMSSFRREKYIQYGGPDGGNGGKGGDVTLVVNEQFNTLLDIGYSRVFKAEDGVNGGTVNKSGRMGKDRIIYVPPGTLVKDPEGRIKADLTEAGQEYLAAKGGQGGLGNASFKSSKNQAPEKAQPGRPGEEYELFLELKMMADVGLVGYPNAGKSSLVNCISSAHPKVGDYPFTTLEPILGIVQATDYSSFVIADIPGIIDGASQGKGLGHQFLKHIERTYSLLFVIDSNESDAYEKFLSLRKELEEFHPKLAEKPYVIAMNKRDLGEASAQQKFIDAGEKFIYTSAVEKKGLITLVRALDKHVRPHQRDNWENEKGNW
ncbi:MAG: GTPase ObgE [Fibrobacterales bacterium]